MLKDVLSHQIAIFCVVPVPGFHVAKVHYVCPSVQRPIQVVVGIGNHVGSISEGCIHTYFHGLRMVHVVRIQIHHIVAAYHLNSFVSGHALTLVLLFIQDKPFVYAAILFSNLSASVCATVVHHDSFPVLVCLSQYAIQGPTQITFHIIDRYDYRNFIHL